MVNRSMRMSWASDSEADQSSHSDGDDSSFVPQEAPSRNGGGRSGRITRNGRNGRKRKRSVQGLFTDSESDSEDTAPTRSRRSAHRHTDSEESEDASVVPRQHQHRRRQRVQELEDSEDEGIATNLEPACVALDHLVNFFQDFNACSALFLQDMRC